MTTVEIWSDVVCPWCYIGKRNFETALAESGRREAVDVRWRSFELNPGRSRTAELPLPEHHRKHVGGSAQQAAAQFDDVVRLARDAGLEYRLDIAMPVNSFDAHRLMKYGEQAGHGDQVRERIMRAYTAEGAILSDLETLVRLGTEAGLDADATREALTGTDFAQAVRDDEDLATRLGVHGVPTFVFNSRVAVSGGRQPRVFAQLLAAAADDPAA